jgi:hypothetical protein
MTERSEGENAMNSSRRKETDGRSYKTSLAGIFIFACDFRFDFVLDGS